MMYILNVVRVQKTSVHISRVWSWLHRMRLPRAEVLRYCDGTSRGEPIMNEPCRDWVQETESGIHPALLHLKVTE